MLAAEGAGFVVVDATNPIETANAEKAARTESVDGHEIWRRKRMKRVI
jgi:hypothetical protein